METGCPCRTSVSISVKLSGCGPGNLTSQVCVAWSRDPAEDQVRCLLRGAPLYAGQGLVAETALRSPQRRPVIAGPTRGRISDPVAPLLSSSSVQQFGQRS